jgi:hypothetical protein
VIPTLCHSERPEGVKNLGFLAGKCEILRRNAAQNDRQVWSLPTYLATPQSEKAPARLRWRTPNSKPGGYSATSRH